MALTKMQLSELLSVYGDLLTDKQRNIVAMYCDCDCTLTEIATEHNITRQCVRDTVTKAENILTKFENCLGVSDFTHQLNVAIQHKDKEQIVKLAQQFVERNFTTKE